MQLFGAGKVKKGLVDGQRLHQRGKGQHAGADLPADSHIMAHPRADHHRIGASLQRLPCRHCRAHAILSGDIAGGGDHTAFASADNHRPVADGGIVAFLDRGIEGIAIDMRDGQAEQLAAAADIRAAALRTGARCGITADIAASQTAPAQHLEAAISHRDAPSHSGPVIARQPASPPLRLRARHCRMRCCHRP